MKKLVIGMIAFGAVSFAFASEYSTKCERTEDVLNVTVEKKIEKLAIDNAIAGHPVMVSQSVSVMSEFSAALVCVVSK